MIKVLHRMRGQIFNIKDRSIFTFGGGLSITRLTELSGHLAA